MSFTPVGFIAIAMLIGSPVQSVVSLSAKAPVHFSNARAEEVNPETLVLGRLQSAPTSYHSVEAVGARIVVRDAREVVGIDLPVISHRVSSFVVRVFGNERDCSVPRIGRDLIRPVRVKTTDSGLQTISVRFDPAPLIVGGQFFIVVDSIGLGVEIISTTDLYLDTCRCSSELFTQQVVERKGQWQTAPYTFPWRVKTRQIPNELTIKFRPDTLGSVGDKKLGGGRISTGFFLQVGDVNGDSHYDILSPIGLFLGSGEHSFVKDSLLDMATGAWTMLPSKSPLLVHVAGPDVVEGERSLVIDRALVPVVVRTVRLASATSKSKIIAIWPLIVDKLDGSLRSHQIALAWYEDSTSSQPRVTVIELNQSTSFVVAEALIPMRGEIASVLSNGAAFSAPDFQDSDSNAVDTRQRFSDLSIVNEEGSSVIRATYSDGTIRFNRPIQTSINVLDVIGPGLEIMADGEHSLALPVVVEAEAQTIGADNDQVAFTGIEQWQREFSNSVWNSDRRSSVVRSDLNGDGRMEYIFPTSDFCWPVHVVTTEPTYNGMLSASTILVDGIETLAGSYDVACIDIDADSKPDLVGYKNGRVIILWNSSPNPSFARDVTRLVEPQVPTRGIGIGRFFCTTCQRRELADSDQQVEMGALPRLNVRPSVFDRACTIEVTGVTAGKLYRVEVMSGLGRLVRYWEIVGGSDQVLSVAWDGLDQLGMPVASGTYVVSVSGNGGRVSRNIQRVR